MSIISLSHSQSHYRSCLPEQDLVDHILSCVSWVPIDDFIRCMSMHCVDGRARCALIGAPGGDAGVFLIGLATVELITQREILVDSVVQLFHSFLQWNGHFYLHTDLHMLEKLFYDLQREECFRGYFEGMDIENSFAVFEQFVRMPPTVLQEKVLDKLIQIVQLGCGHLALMREHSEEYGIHRSLIDAFLVAFYHALWRGERIEWEVLYGDHEERAVVNVYAVADHGVFSELPLVCPNCRGEQVFVNHPQAVHLVLERMYIFASRCFSDCYFIDKKSFIDHATALFQKHMRITLNYLAKGLPLYDVWVSKNGVCQVLFKGKV